MLLEQMNRDGKNIWGYRFAYSSNINIAKRNNERKNTRWWAAKQIVCKTLKIRWYITAKAPLLFRPLNAVRLAVQFPAVRRDFKGRHTPSYSLLLFISLYSWIRLFFYLHRYDPTAFRVLLFLTIKTKR